MAWFTQKRGEATAELRSGVRAWLRPHYQPQFSYDVMETEHRRGVAKEKKVSVALPPEVWLGDMLQRWARLPPFAYKAVNNKDTLHVFHII